VVRKRKREEGGREGGSEREEVQGGKFVSLQTFTLKPKIA
jgi:hypothetical protein